MYKLIHGDIFTAQVDAIVNPVNCIGTMGAGLALQFKNKFPDMAIHYKYLCEAGIFSIGSTMYWPTKGIIPSKFIINMPTKDDWQKPSELIYIKKGLRAIDKTAADYKIRSVAFPKIGCGLGGLDFDDVEEVIKYYFEDSKIDCYVYSLSKN